MLEMWKWEYEKFKLSYDQEINDPGWEQSLVVVGIVEEEILRF